MNFGLRWMHEAQIMTALPKVDNNPLGLLEVEGGCANESLVCSELRQGSQDFVKELWRRCVVMSIMNLDMFAFLLAKPPKDTSFRVGSIYIARSRVL